jgi:methionyl aminopeptidase
MIQLKSSREIDRMAVAGTIVGRTFVEAVAPLIAVGTTTREIDESIRDFVRAEGGELLFLDYHGFPAHSCISVNEEVVHGIPGARLLRGGDMVSIDIGVRRDGFCADAARTYLVGDVGDTPRAVLDCCLRALVAGIDAARPGRRLSELSGAIEKVIRAAGLGLVEKYVGHGIGREMHEEPQVPNFVGPVFQRYDPTLRPGLVLAIEPMVNSGTGDVRTLADGWTVVTADGGVSAHCEHTVAVTEGEPRILTLAPGELWPPPELGG